MKALFTALVNKISGTAFSTGIGGRFYLGKAPQSAVMPYCVFQTVSGVPDNTFTEDLQNRVVQFTLYDNDPSSASGILDDYANLRTVFDDCKLTVTGYMHLTMDWESEIGPEPDITDPATWQLVCEYRILTEKT